jgi:hypothetical protein
MDIYEQVKKIKTQEEFASFLNYLVKNLKEQPIEWENDNLASFIDGMAGYCIDQKQEAINWQVFAEILLAGKVYE